MYRYIKMIHSYDVKLMMSNLPASHFQFSGGRSFAPVAGSAPVILQFFSAGAGPFLPRTFDSTNKNISNSINLSKVINLATIRLIRKPHHVNLLVRGYTNHG